MAVTLAGVVAGVPSAAAAARSRFSDSEAWTTSAFFGTKSTSFADVTGDGRADAIVVNGDKTTVRQPVAPVLRVERHLLR